MSPFFRRRNTGDRSNPAVATASGVQRGLAAEQFARRYLQDQGLAIVATNYRARRGEIDIVARDNGTLAFVEVRLRSNSNFGGPSASIDYRKQERLVSAAQQYLQEHDLVDTAPCRFDALCLSRPGSGAGWQVDWIRDAFWPGN